MLRDRFTAHTAERISERRNLCVPHATMHLSAAEVPPLPADSYL